MSTGDRGESDEDRFGRRVGFDHTADENETFSDDQLAVGLPEEKLSEESRFIIKHLRELIKANNRPVTIPRQSANMLAREGIDPDRLMARLVRERQAELDDHHAKPVIARLAGYIVNPAPENRVPRKVDGLEEPSKPKVPGQSSFGDRQNYYPPHGPTGDRTLDPFRTPETGSGKVVAPSSAFGPRMTPEQSARWRQNKADYPQFADIIEPVDNSQEAGNIIGIDFVSGALFIRLHYLDRTYPRSDQSRLAVGDMDRDTWGFIALKDIKQDKFGIRFIPGDTLLAEEPSYPNIVPIGRTANGFIFTRISQLLQDRTVVVLHINTVGDHEDPPKLKDLKNCVSGEIYVAELQPGFHGYIDEDDHEKAWVMSVFVKVYPEAFSPTGAKRRTIWRSKKDGEIRVYKGLPGMDHFGGEDAVISRLSHERERDRDRVTAAWTEESSRDEIVELTNLEPDRSPFPLVCVLGICRLWSMGPGTYGYVRLGDVARGTNRLPTSTQVFPTYSTGAYLVWRSSHDGNFYIGDQHEYQKAATDTTSADRRGDRPMNAEIGPSMIQARRDDDAMDNLMRHGTKISPRDGVQSVDRLANGEWGYISGRISVLGIESNTSMSGHRSNMHNLPFGRDRNGNYFFGLVDERQLESPNNKKVRVTYSNATEFRNLNYAGMRADSLFNESELPPITLDTLPEGDWVFISKRGIDGEPGKSIEIPLTEPIRRRPSATFSLVIGRTKGGDFICIPFTDLIAETDRVTLIAEIIPNSHDSHNYEIGRALRKECSLAEMPADTYGYVDLRSLLSAVKGFDRFKVTLLARTKISIEAMGHWGWRAIVYKDAHERITIHNVNDRDIAALQSSLR